MQTLSATGGNNGGSTFIREDGKLKCVGNIFPSGYSSGNVYSADGLSPTLNTGNHGVGTIIRDTKEHNVNLEGEERSNDIIRIDKGYKPQGSRVYSSEGVSTCLNTGTGELYKVNNDKKVEPTINLKGNVYPSKHSTGNVYSDDGLSPIITCSNSRELKVTTKKSEGLKFRVNTKKGYEEGIEGDGVRLDFPNSKTGRSRTLPKTSHTLLTHGNNGVVTDDLCIRRLTPVECERLQGFPDNWTQYGMDGESISDTQRYKCCGNAVTVNVIECIMNDWDMWF